MGIMENKMGTTILCSYIGLYRGYIGVWGFRVAKEL